MNATMRPPAQSPTLDGLGSAAASKVTHQRIHADARSDADTTPMGRYGIEFADFLEDLTFRRTAKAHGETYMQFIKTATRERIARLAPKAVELSAKEHTHFAQEVPKHVARYLEMAQADKPKPRTDRGHVHPDSDKTDVGEPDEDEITRLSRLGNSMPPSAT